MSDLRCRALGLAAHLGDNSPKMLHSLIFVAGANAPKGQQQKAQQAARQSREVYKLLKRLACGHNGVCRISNSDGHGQWYSPIAHIAQEGLRYDLNATRRESRLISITAGSN